MPAVRESVHERTRAVNILQASNLLIARRRAQVPHSTLRDHKGKGEDFAQSGKHARDGGDC